MRLFTRFLVVAGLLLVAGTAYGQGSTTAAITGKVVDQSGTPLVGATVTARHVPTGTLAGAYSTDAGRFTLLNLRVGGPYTIEVTFLGFETYTRQGVMLNLGQTLDLAVTLLEEGVDVDEVVVTAESSEIFDGKRTGSETNISREDLDNTPTINRSIADFARLTPQATVGSDGSIEIAGSNNRYNNISIDGAVSNDVFGLAGTGTPGGQTNSRNGTQTAGQISVDAIEEIQVVIAPFDVRQGGFTGGGINAVTRSGTNQFEGSVYYYFKNQSLTGELVVPRENTEERFAFGNDFSYQQGGFRIGGPIIKNKLFFFVSTEITRSDEPRILLPGDPARDAFNTPASVSALNDISNYLTNVLGYPESDPFGPFTNEFFNDKVLLKLDWNISDVHRLSLRHNYVRSRKNEAPSGAFSYSANGGGQDFTSIYNSTVAELTSTWTRSSNKLRLVYQTTADDRDPNMAPFPNIRIDNVDGSADVFVGNERFSMVNMLDQLNIALTNDFSLYRGNHTITVGMHHEYFRFDNRFIRNAYGSYRLSYGALQSNISNGTPFTVSSNNYAVSYANPALGLPEDWGPEFDAFQLGFYAQDEWAVTPKINLTIGLRADIPFVTASPAANPTFNNDPLFAGLDVATDQVPDTRILLAPRVGVNWDVFGDKSLAVRGGFGIFTGRVPFVWISNQFGNTGIEIVRFEGQFSGSSVPFRYIPGAPRLGALTIEEFNALTGENVNPELSEINVTAKDFRYPQVFRVNVGADYKLPVWGLIASFDVLFGKTLNNIHYEDLTTVRTGTDLVAPGPGGDARPLWNSQISPNYTNVILLRNTNRGYNYNVTLQLRKPFTNGFTGQVAYTYGRATSVNDGTSSQAISNWRFTPNVYGLNSLDANPSTTSNYQRDHRFIASGTYNFKWANDWLETDVTLFYRGESGQRFSYLYGNDINGEDFEENDLIFIPANPDQIRFQPLTTYRDANGNNVQITAAEQWSLLNSYIESDKYLRENRGKYMDRNGAQTPWNHQIDLSLRQSFHIQTNGRPHTIQLTMDIFNVLNLLNNEWGRQYFVGFNTVQLLEPDGFDFDGVPFYRFTPEEVPDFNEPYSTDANRSIWQMQLGVRYSF